jgi:hypothetical protein
MLCQILEVKIENSPSSTRDRSSGVDGEVRVAGVGHRYGRLRHQELKGQLTLRSWVQEGPSWEALPTLVLKSHSPRLTLISFPEPVSFASSKSRWRSQYVRDEYFIS